jgi:hypothetical protein
MPLGTTFWRGTAAFGLSIALTMLFAINQAKALNILSDSFLMLSARPLGMGGATCAVPQMASVFSNPAGLANLRRLSFMHNHSARHFPGSREGRGTEWDQLDSDTQCLVVPLPFSTYAHGFTIAGELGYDYRNLPAPGQGGTDRDVAFTVSCGYPKEQYWGTETVDAWAFGSFLPCSFGVSNRRHFSRFTPDPVDLSTTAWARFGEGQQWGLLGHPLPGLSLATSDLRIDFNYAALPAAQRPPPAVATGFPDYSQRLRLTRRGYAFQPCGWLTFAGDTVNETHRFVGENGSLPAGLDDSEAKRLFSGVELTLGGLGVLRRGDFDGHPTTGLSINLLGASGGLMLNYAEVDGLLPELVGAGAGFESVHVYGFDLPLL